MACKCTGTRLIIQEVRLNSCAKLRLSPKKPQFFTGVPRFKKDYHSLWASGPLWVCLFSSNRSGKGSHSSSGPPQLSIPPLPFLHQLCSLALLHIFSVSLLWIFLGALSHAWVYQYSIGICQFILSIHSIFSPLPCISIISMDGLLITLKFFTGLFQDVLKLYWPYLKKPRQRCLLCRPSCLPHINIA
jgi:hypothetical protein